MAASKVVLTTSRIWLLEVPLLPEQRIADRSLLSCALKWRQDKLWVRLAPPSIQANIPALQNEQWLQDCLKHSPIHVVCLDHHLGAAGLKYIADACRQAGKLVFLRLPSCLRPSRHLRQSRLRLWLGQTTDRMLAVLLLIVFSPLLLGLFLLLRFSAPEPVFSSEWRVGARGRLFRLLNFWGCEEGKQNGQRHLTPIRHWIVKLRLNKLPQLISVAQGELRLVGQRPWNLQEASHFDGQLQPICESPGVIQTLSVNFLAKPSFVK